MRRARWRWPEGKRTTRTEYRKVEADGTSKLNRTRQPGAECHALSRVRCASEMIELRRIGANAPNGAGDGC